MKLYSILLFVCIYKIKTSICREAIENSKSHRDAKFLVSFPEERCTVDNNVGVCYTKKKCSRVNGKRIGTCGHGYGTCCQFIARCNIDDTVTVTRNQTILIEPPNFPRTCTFMFPRQSGVCQIRLDFQRLALNQPSITGDCLTDFLSVSGTVTVDQLKICGMGATAAQHIYLDYGSSTGPIQVQIRTNGSSAPLYGYEIHTTQIKCDSLERVPWDCLQYYRNQTGIVTSFNHNPQLPLMSQQMNNEDYKVCVEKRNPGDRLQWALCSGRKPLAENCEVGNVYDLSIIGTGGVEGPAARPGENQNCVTDYLEIPGSTLTRYCRAVFPNPITTASFWLRVNFDDTEPQTLLVEQRLTLPCELQMELVNQLSNLYTSMTDTATNECVLTPKSTQTDMNNAGFCLAFQVVDNAVPIGDGLNCGKLF